MAIIKTGDSWDLAGDLAWQLTWTFSSSSQFLYDVRDLGDLLSGNSGASESGDYSWATVVGATSASYSETYSDYQDDFGDWIENSTEKYSLTGSNLDGALVEDPQKASSLTYSWNEVLTSNQPGYIGKETEVERYSVALTYDLTNPTVVTFGNFSTSYQDSYSYSGYEDAVTDEYPDIDNGSGWDKDSATFVGSATWDMTTDSFAGYSYYPATLTGVTVKSYAYSYSGFYDDTYGWDDTKYRESYSGSYKLVGSGSGLSAALGESGWTVEGTIASLTMIDKWAGTEEDDDGVYKYSGLEYYSYVNPSSAADAFDIAVLQNNLNAQLAYDVAWDQFYSNGYQSVDLEALLAAQDALNLSREALAEEFLKGNDIITVSDVDGGYIYAGAGNDKVIGGKGSDSLYGASGNDNINGGTGWDYIEGGEGSDVIKGGSGDDEIYGDDEYYDESHIAGDDFIDGGTGNDYIEGGEGNDRLLGGADEDELYGEEGDDTLDGGTGDDLLDGGTGNDVLLGGAGQDVLRGGAGDDSLNGGAGNDVIMGGAGVDVLTGGTGLDGFVFAMGDSGDLDLSLASLDQIKDFNVAQDRLQLFTDSDYGYMEAYVLTSADTDQLGKAGSYADLLAAAQLANGDGGQLYVVGYDNANTYLFADLDDNGFIDTVVQLVGIKGDAVANALVIEAYS